MILIVNGKGPPEGGSTPIAQLAFRKPRLPNPHICIYAVANSSEVYFSFIQLRLNNIASDECKFIHPTNPRTTIAVTAKMIEL